MKLRIFQNSIRLRLSRGEVTQLAENQTIQMRTDLFPQPLIYQLASNKGDTSTATFQSGVLRVTVPASQLKHWALSDQVGIHTTLQTNGEARLNLQIEKDFKCLHGEAEDQQDCFANPLAGVE